MTGPWECRLFAFILVIIDVNESLIIRYFIYCGLCREGSPTLLKFRWNFLWGLINNIYLGVWEGGGELIPDSMNRLITVPSHARRYQDRRWICTAKSAYQRYSFSFTCVKKIRTYCVCTPGVWICSYCNVQRVLIEIHDD